DIAIPAVGVRSFLAGRFSNRIRQPISYSIYACALSMHLAKPVMPSLQQGQPQPSATVTPTYFPSTLTVIERRRDKTMSVYSPSFLSCLELYSIASALIIPLFRAGMSALTFKVSSFTLIILLPFQ